MSLQLTLQHENAGGTERAPKRAQRGPYTGRGASTVGLLSDRTRIFKAGSYLYPRSGTQGWAGPRGWRDFQSVRSHFDK